MSHGGASIGASAAMASVRAAFVAATLCVERGVYMYIHRVERARLEHINVNILSVCDWSECDWGVCMWRVRGCAAPSRHAGVHPLVSLHDHMFTSSKLHHHRTHLQSVAAVLAACGRLVSQM